MGIYTAKPYIDDKICEDVVSVLKSGIIAQGPKVKKLEEEFSKYCNVKYCAAVNSGTAALHSALYAAGIKSGDEVITTPFTFVASANSIFMVGAKPVFVDIDENTFNIDPGKIEDKISSNTKAILPVHLYGLLADMDKINNIARKNNLKVVEDACQAHGAKIREEKAGSIGDFGTFSFYATKNMMTAEGGCVTSNNEDYIEMIKSFRHHGQSLKDRYNYLDFGYNYRMTDIAASIGLNQLHKIGEFNLKRQNNGELYNTLFESIEGIESPFIPDNYTHVYHQYTIKVISEIFGHTRDELVEELKKNDIFPGIFYPKPLHQFPTFQKLGYKEGDFPVSEKVSKMVISLPVHPGITEQDVKKVVDVIAGFKR